MDDGTMDDATDDSPPPDRRLTPAVWLATGLGVGLVAPAPGTVGALWGLAWAWWLTSGLAPAWAWATVPLGILLGGPLCGRAARDLGGAKDPGAVVWDEIATVPMVFALTPTVGWTSLLLGFGLHRLLDITKPPPCRRLERLPGGWGIMLDDVAAAGYAAVLLFGLAQAAALIA
ncbi:MAG: phosphatidylglycerophosphatase A [Planctomycetota bacterium]